jgi:hypothetical protein
MMLHYFGTTLHAVIYLVVSFAVDAVTNIVTTVTAFPLPIKQHTDTVQLYSYN